MEKDRQRARGKLIAKTLEMREQQPFANSQQIMQAVHYFPLIPLGPGVSPIRTVSNCLNTCVKLVYDVPRSKFT